MSLPPLGNWPSPSSPAAQAALGLLAYGARELVMVPFRVATFPFRLAQRGFEAMTSLAGTATGMATGTASRQPSQYSSYATPAAPSYADPTAPSTEEASAAEGWLDYSDDDLADPVADLEPPTGPADLADMGGDPAPVTDPAMGGYADEALERPLDDVLASDGVVSSGNGRVAADSATDAVEKAESDTDTEPAPDIVTRAVEAAEAAAADTDAPSVDRADLPIADFDHVTAGSLRGRLRRLEIEDLRLLRAYEQEHGRRLPILTLLENRIAKLEAVGTT